jgi:hypothetical protein
MEDESPYDIKSQEATQAERALTAKLAKESEESDFRWLMRNERGRRIVWRLLDQAGVFRSTFNPTAMVMAFAEGNRNFGNRTLTLVLEHCPELFILMIKEASNARPRRDR